MGIQPEVFQRFPLNKPLESLRAFGKPCRDRGSKSLMVDDFDLFRDSLTMSNF